jgi:diacylglycerol kinase (ATP)
VPQEIALLTNPTSGKGKGGRTVDQVLPRLRDAGYVVRNLVGRDADEALDLAQQCVADEVETLVVVGGDGMVHLAIQALADSGTRLGLVPAGTGNDVARYFDLPRNDVAAATDIVIGGKERRVDLARIGSKYFVTVLAAGFDAIVNERANEMTWPKGQMRYNLATVAELRTFKHRRCRARRRPARCRRDPPDEQARARAYLPQAVQGHPRAPSRLPPPPREEGDHRGPRHHGVRRR